MAPASERLMLLDTASLYFRAFYGVPDTVRAPDGRPVNAVRGLLDFIAKLVTDYPPTRLIACWDDDWRPQWRVDLIPSYKAHRVAEELAPGEAAPPAAGSAAFVEEVPDPLSPQVPVIREVLAALDIPVVGAAGCEADDVIGTLATGAGVAVDVVTGDRDLFQLVDDAAGVRVVYTGRGMSNLEVLDEAAIVGKYGIRASQYADFAMMRGDASDGLPGVAGVGEKTAAGLLGEYGDAAGIAAAVADPSSKLSASVRAKFTAAADYLAVAPRVVAVLRDAALPEHGDGTIHELDADHRARFDALVVEHGLGESARRALRALGQPE